MIDPGDRACNSKMWPRGYPVYYERPQYDHILERERWHQAAYAEPEYFHYQHYDSIRSDHYEHYNSIGSDHYEHYDSVGSDHYGPYRRDDWRWNPMPHQYIGHSWSEYDERTNIHSRRLNYRPFKRKLTHDDNQKSKNCKNPNNIELVTSKNTLQKPKTQESITSSNRNIQNTKSLCLKASVCEQSAEANLQKPIKQLKLQPGETRCLKSEPRNSLLVITSNPLNTIQLNQTNNQGTIRLGQTDSLKGNQIGNSNSQSTSPTQLNQPKSPKCLQVNISNPIETKQEDQPNLQSTIQLDLLDQQMSLQQLGKKTKQCLQAGVETNIQSVDKESVLGKSPKVEQSIESVTKPREKQGSFCLNSTVCETSVDSKSQEPQNTEQAVGYDLKTATSVQTNPQKTENFVPISHQESKVVQRKSHKVKLSIKSITKPRENQGSFCLNSIVCEKSVDSESQEPQNTEQAVKYDIKVTATPVQTKPQMTENFVPLSHQKSKNVQRKLHEVDPSIKSITKPREKQVSFCSKSAVCEKSVDSKLQELQNTEQAVKFDKKTAMSVQTKPQKIGNFVSLSHQESKVVQRKLHEVDPSIKSITKPREKQVSFCSKSAVCEKSVDSKLQEPQNTEQAVKFDKKTATSVQTKPQKIGNFVSLSHQESKVVQRKSHEVEPSIKSITKPREKQGSNCSNSIVCGTSVKSKSQEPIKLCELKPKETVEYIKSKLQDTEQGIKSDLQKTAASVQTNLFKSRDFVQSSTQDDKVVQSTLQDTILPVQAGPQKAIQFSKCSLQKNKRSAHLTSPLVEVSVHSDHKKSISSVQWNPQVSVQTVHLNEEKSPKLILPKDVQQSTKLKSQLYVQKTKHVQSDLKEDRLSSNVNSQTTQCDLIKAQIAQAIPKLQEKPLSLHLKRKVCEQSVESSIHEPMKLKKRNSWMIVECTNPKLQQNTSQAVQLGPQKNALSVQSSSQKTKTFTQSATQETMVLVQSSLQKTVQSVQPSFYKEENVSRLKEIPQLFISDLQQPIQHLLKPKEAKLSTSKPQEVMKSSAQKMPQMLSKKGEHVQSDLNEDRHSIIKMLQETIQCNQTTPHKRKQCIKVIQKQDKMPNDSYLKLTKYEKSGERLQESVKLMVQKLDKTSNSIETRLQNPEYIVQSNSQETNDGSQSIPSKKAEHVKSDLNEDRHSIIKMLQETIQCIQTKPRKKKQCVKAILTQDEMPNDSYLKLAKCEKSREKLQESVKLMEKKPDKTLNSIETRLQNPEYVVHSNSQETIDGSQLIPSMTVQFIQPISPVNGLFTQSVSPSSEQFYPQKSAHFVQSSLLRNTDHMQLNTKTTPPVHSDKMKTTQFIESSSPTLHLVQSNVKTTQPIQPKTQKSTHLSQLDQQNSTQCIQTKLQETSKPNQDLVDDPGTIAGKRVFPTEHCKKEKFSIGVEFNLGKVIHQGSDDDNVLNTQNKSENLVMCRDNAVKTEKISEEYDDQSLNTKRVNSLDIANNNYDNGGSRCKCLPVYKNLFRYKINTEPIIQSDFKSDNDILSGVDDLETSSSDVHEEFDDLSSMINKHVHKVTVLREELKEKSNEKMYVDGKVFDIKLEHVTSAELELQNDTGNDCTGDLLNGKNIIEASHAMRRSQEKRKDSSSQVVLTQTNSEIDKEILLGDVLEKSLLDAVHEECLDLDSIVDEHIDRIANLKEQLKKKSNEKLCSDGKACDIKLGHVPRAELKSQNNFGNVDFNMQMLSSKDKVEDGHDKVKFQECSNAQEALTKYCSGETCETQTDVGSASSEMQCSPAFISVEPNVYSRLELEKCNGPNDSQVNHQQNIGPVWEKKSNFGSYPSSDMEKQVSDINLSNLREESQANVGSEFVDNECSYGNVSKPVKSLKPRQTMAESSMKYHTQKQWKVKSANTNLQQTDTCPYVIEDKVVDRCPNGHFLKPALASFNLQTGKIIVPCKKCKIVVCMQSKVTAVK